MTLEKISPSVTILLDQDTFMDYDNNVLKTEIVLQNKNATPPMVKERDVIDKNLSPLLPLIANEKITIKH